MPSIIHRPTVLLPDMFGWLESGWPFTSNPVRVEEYADGDRYVVRAELPGCDPHNDIQVTVEHGHLILTAERKQHEHRRGHSEFRYGSFSRTLPLPVGVRSDDVTARYTNGILEVSMPSVDVEGPKAVHVEIDKVE